MSTILVYIFPSQSITKHGVSFHLITILLHQHTSQGSQMWHSPENTLCGRRYLNRNLIRRLASSLRTEWNQTIFILSQQYSMWMNGTADGAAMTYRGFHTTHRLSSPSHEKVCSWDIWPVRGMTYMIHWIAFERRPKIGERDHREDRMSRKHTHCYSSIGDWCEGGGAFYRSECTLTEMSTLRSISIFKFQI